MDFSSPNMKSDRGVAERKADYSEFEPAVLVHLAILSLDALNPKLTFG